MAILTIPDDASGSGRRLDSNDQGVDDGKDLTQKETSREGGVLRFLGPVLRVALTLLLLALGFHVVGTFVSSSTHT